MSQQAYQQQESVQQRYRRILNRATSTTDRAFYWDGLYYQDLQPAQLPQQYHSSLNSSQSPTDVQTFGSLPTYSISQSQPYMDDSNLAVYEELVTGFIHQQNDAPSTWPSLTTHPQQRQSHVIRRQQQGKPDIVYNKEWIERSIREGSIHRYSKSDVEVKCIPFAAGSYGSVSKATIKHTGMLVALKTLFLPSDGCEEKRYKKFAKELKNHKKVNGHPNIIRFLGVYEDDGYHMIFEFANGGTLRTHLMQHFRSLTWEHKYKLSMEITNGLKYMHDLDIIHKDLSDFNILLKSGVAKITDFGLSGQMMSSSSGEGTAAYRDPLSFRNQSYKRGKKSDIFSLGVLFWEISSGQIPCKNWTSIVIAECRKQGYRDPPLPETPEAFVQLYSACWSENPEERPSCKEIHKQLKLLLDDEDQHLLLPGKY